MKQKKGITKLVDTSYMVPFILITSLFFLWGGVRSIMDVLNKHFQMTMGVSHTHAALMQTVIYGAYFLMALPGGQFIRRFGTRSGIVFGLMLFGIGALMFIPTEFISSFYYILLPLFIIGCGLVILEIAANPYVTLLGDPATAAGRLNRAQSFNGLGSICGALFGGLFFFGREGEIAHIAIPYSIIGLVVLVVAFYFSHFRLPDVLMDARTDTPKRKKTGKPFTHSLFIFGFLALLCYEIAEISINTFFINYVSDDGFMTPLQASMVLSFGGLGLFMCGRFIGSILMRRFTAERLLHICAIGTVLTSAIVIAHLGVVSIVALVTCYVFESIMFPTIFALTLRTAGTEWTERASSILMMTVIGGSIGPLLTGYVADHLSVPTAFIVPFMAFIIVWLFAFRMDYGLKHTRTIQSTVRTSREA